MAYSRWSDSDWYSYWSNEPDDEFVMIIHHKHGGCSKVVWDDQNPAEMSDDDISAIVNWNEFVGVKHRKELIKFVRTFFEDAWNEITPEPLV